MELNVTQAATSGNLLPPRRVLSFSRVAHKYPMRGCDYSHVSKDYFYFEGGFLSAVS